MFDYSSFRGKNSSSSAWLKAKREEFNSAGTSANLQRDVNLMLSRQEPLDKIARDLNLDYETLKKSVSKINPAYERDVTNKSKTPVEQVLNGTKQFVWDDMIIGGLVNPAVDFVRDTTNILESQKALDARDVKVKLLKQKRDMIFGKQSTWTDKQYNDKAFIKRYQDYNNKILEASKLAPDHLDQLKKVKEIDPRKYAANSAEQFLNVASFGLLKAGLKAGETAVSTATRSLMKKATQVSGKELTHISAKPLPGTDLISKTARKTTQDLTTKNLYKVVGAELAKEVPFGAAYGLTYTGRTVDDPTINDYLKGAAFGGAVAVPFGLVLPVLGRTKAVRLQKKAESFAVKELQTLYDHKLRSQVELGEITRRQANKMSRDYAEKLPQMIKDTDFSMQLAGFSENTGSKIQTTNDTGTGRRAVSEQEAADAAQAALRREGAQAVETGVQQADTAVGAVDEATAATLNSLENEINNLQAIPETQRTTAQNIQLAETKAAYDNVLSAAQSTEARLTADMPAGSQPRPLTSSKAPVSAPGETKLAAGQTTTGKSYQSKSVPYDGVEPQSLSQPAPAPTRMQILQDFVRTSERIDKFARELQRLKMIDAANLTPKQMARQTILEATIRALKERPGYQAVLQTAGVDTASASRTLESMLQEIYDIVKANGGITIDLGGNKKAEGFAFSPYKDSEKIIREENFTIEDIGQYIDDHISELNKPGSHLGIFTLDGDIYLDVAKVGPATPETLALAQDARQIAVYDLKNEKPIDTGTIENGVYNKVDEATNIFNQYQEQIQGTTQEGSLGGVSEVSAKEAGSGTTAGQTTAQEVSPSFTNKTELSDINRILENTDTAAADGQPIADYYRTEKGEDWSIQYMSPDEYLQRAAKAMGKKTDAEITDWINKPMGNPEEYAAAMAKGEKFPMPYINEVTGGQEGRTRALAAKLNGETSIPVAVAERYNPSKTATAQEVSNTFKGADATPTSEAIPNGVDEELFLMSDLQQEVTDGRLTSRVLDKLNSMVAKGITKVVEPLASTTYGSKIRQAMNTVEKRLYYTQADAVRPIIKAIQDKVLPANARLRIEEAIGNVRRSTQMAQVHMLTDANWQRVVAPVEKNGVFKQAVLEGEDLQKLNRYIEAKAELNLMKIDKVKDEVRQKKFETTVKELDSPDFQDRYDALIRYSDGLLDKMVESGIVSKDAAKQWRAENSEYIRIQRVMDDISLRGREGFGGKSTASFGSTIAEQKRVGSSRQVRDLIEVQAERTERIFFELEKNRASNLLIDMYKQIGQEFADPVRLAENVFTRKALRDSLMESRPLKVAFNRFYKTQRAYVARLETELNQLNKQGLNAYLKGASKDKKVIDLSTRIKILRQVDPNIPLEAIKADGKWNFGQAPDLETVKAAMARSKYRNGITGAPTDALKTYAKRNGLTEDEALVKLYMKERKFDGFEYGNKEFIINDTKLAKKAGEMVVKGETKGTLTGVTSGADKKMGLQNTINAMDNLVSYQTSDLLAIKRKIARREPKLAEAIDELINIKSQLDEINLKRKSEWEQIMQLADNTQKSMPTINRYVDGIKEVYITQPEIEAAVKGWDAAPMNAVLRAVNIPTRVLKTTITGALNPAYVLKAVIRDPIESFVLSPNARATHSAPNIWRSITESAGKDPLFKEFMRTEGGSSAYIDYIRKPKAAAALIREQSNQQLPKVQRGITIIKNPTDLWRKFEDVSRWQEQYSRFMNFRGTYDDAVKRGLSEADALVEARWAARNNQVDFFRTGDWSPVLNSLFPYFNSSLQGGARLGRAFREKPVTTSMKVLAAVQIPQAMVTMYNLSDPNRAEIYLDIPDYERANNWVFVLPGSEKTNGRWETIKIPKPPGVGAFAAPVEAMGVAMYGYDPQKFVDLTQAFIQGAGIPIQAGSPSQVMGSFVPQVIKPGIQAVTNFDFYTGKEIVPSWLKEANPEPFNQAFDGSSTTAKSLGKLLNISPVAIEHFLSDSFGEFGKNALNQADSVAQATGLTTNKAGGKSVLTSFMNTLYTSPGGVVNREVKNQVDDILNGHKSTSSLITELVGNDNVAAASRVAQDYNNSIDVLLAQIYAKPNLTSLSVKQLNYLESQKFPLQNGSLTASSIKYRQKQAPSQPIKFELK